MKPFYDIGLYVGECIEQGLQKASTGTPQIVFKVKILGEPDGQGGYNPCTQQYQRTIYMPLTAGTASFVTEALERIGFRGTSFAALDPSSPAFQDFKGEQFELWCAHKEYNGDYSEKWSISTGGKSKADVVPLSKQEMRALDNLFGKNLKGKAAQPASGKTLVDHAREVPPADAYTNQHGVEIDDSDVPF
jgi:hypothetical protein